MCTLWHSSKQAKQLTKHSIFPKPARLKALRREAGRGGDQLHYYYYYYFYYYYYYFYYYYYYK